jgi:hypothetical protein
MARSLVFGFFAGTFIAVYAFVGWRRITGRRPLRRPAR